MLFFDRAFWLADQSRPVIEIVNLVPQRLNNAETIADLKDSYRVIQWIPNPPHPKTGVQSYQIAYVPSACSIIYI